MFQSPPTRYIKHHQIPWNHHSPMVFLWFSYGFPMVFLWWNATIHFNCGRTSPRKFNDLCPRCQGGRSAIGISDVQHQSHPPWNLIGWWCQPNCLVVYLWIIYGSSMVSGWWLTYPTPLKNMRTRQLGWWHSQYIPKYGQLKNGPNHSPAYLQIIWKSKNKNHPRLGKMMKNLRIRAMGQSQRVQRQGCFCKRSRWLRCNVRVVGWSSLLLELQPWLDPKAWSLWWMSLQMWDLDR